MFLFLIVSGAVWADDDVGVFSNQGAAVAPTTDAISIPRMLSYQGKLSDSLGNPVPDGNYQLTFRLFTQESGGTPFWEETQTIRVINGCFSALLGALSPLTSIPDAGVLYLGMAVQSENELSPRLRIVSAAYAYIAARADTANYAFAGVNSEKTWERGIPDSVLFTVNLLGVARGKANNMLYGDYRCTHTNLGVACTTGTPNQDYAYCGVAGGLVNKATGVAAFVGGGYGNDAVADYATVAGGDANTASGSYAAIGGGSGNSATASRATVAGGRANAASGTNAAVAGGKFNIASGYCAMVGGGIDNVASDNCAAIGGGSGNAASASRATVAGGFSNTASGANATVAGGSLNVASGSGSAVAGGEYDTAAADYSFTAGFHSVVSAGYDNSAAFNGQTATAANQLRCGILSKAGGSFTIDHPLDPSNKILNHYFIEGPEMRNLYDGEVILDASGRTTVYLPEYFSALNRKPRIQLTGVGTADVYVAEDIKGNSFVIGGKPNTKVYWLVTGERQDVSAEAIRRMMPVEQLKAGELAGRMLDDDFLSGCMEQLELEGEAEGLNFGTVVGRKRYEAMKNRVKTVLER